MDISLFFHMNVRNRSLENTADFIFLSLINMFLAFHVSFFYKYHIHVLCPFFHCFGIINKQEYYFFVVCLFILCLMTAFNSGFKNLIKCISLFLYDLYFCVAFPILFSKSFSTFMSLSRSPMFSSKSLRFAFHISFFHPSRFDLGTL